MAFIKNTEVNAGEKYTKDAVSSMMDQLAHQTIYKKEKKVRRGPNYIEPVFRQAAKPFAIQDERGKTIRRFWTENDLQTFLFQYNYNVIDRNGIETNPEVSPMTANEEDGDEINFN